MSIEVLKNALPEIPNLSGVYKMRDINATLIYIGKAKNLQKRVQSYTKINELSPKTRTLVENIASIEFEITPSEKDALILEASLIKKHQPKYNILLKDDKSRQYIKLSHHKFPAIVRYRGKFERKASLFGPFGYIQGSKFSTNDTIKYITTFVNKVFNIRSCKDSKFNIHQSCGKPCMEFQIKTCSGPCAGMISKADYEKSIENAKKFLQGADSEVYKNIKEKITLLAQKENFVEAELLKNQILSIENLKSSSSDVNFTKFENIDVIAIGESLTKVEVFAIRNGYALGGNLFEIHKHDGTISEILEAFILEYYSKENPPPKKIFTSHEVSTQNLKILFKELFGLTAEITNPKQGEAKVLLDFVLTNLQFQIGIDAKEKNEFAVGMEHIRKAFELDFVPNRVEIYDNSHISGAFFTGAFVVASQKGFEKSQYRKFNAKYSKGGDDYSMMAEVMTRRFASDSLIGNFPDLLVIDGGLGQFHAVTKVLDELGITIPVVSIAKGRNRNAGNETFFTHKNPEGFKLSNKQALYFIEILRDESHRFVITSHRKRRDKI